MGEKLLPILMAKWAKWDISNTTTFKLMGFSAQNSSGVHLCRARSGSTGVRSTFQKDLKKKVKRLQLLGIPPNLHFSGAFDASFPLNQGFLKIITPSGNDCYTASRNITIFIWENSRHFDWAIFNNYTGNSHYQRVQSISDDFLL